MLSTKKLIAKMLQAPFVIEEGTSGIWTYRKWSDGTAECWGRLSWTISTWGTWGNIYYSNTSTNEALPSGLFTETPVINATLMAGGGDGWLGEDTAALPSKTNVGGYYKLRATAGSSHTSVIAFHVIGKWR